MALSKLVGTTGEMWEKKIFSRSEPRKLRQKRPVKAADPESEFSNQRLAALGGADFKGNVWIVQIVMEQSRRGIEHQLLKH